METLILEGIAILVTLISGIAYYKAKREENQNLYYVSLLFFLPGLFVTAINGLFLMKEMNIQINL